MLPAARGSGEQAAPLVSTSREAVHDGATHALAPYTADGEVDCEQGSGSVVFELVNVSVVAAPGAAGTGLPPRCILDRVNLTVYRGETLFVIGASGSGKTRLLRLLNRLDNVSSGSVQVWGRCVEAYAPRQLRGQLVGYVSQQPTLASLRASRASGGERGDSEQGRLSLQAVWQFILAQRRKQGDQLTQVATRAALETPVAIGTLSSDDYQRRLDETLRVAKVDPVLLDRPLSALSGGERSRVALARALLLQPRILVLDEVTSSLDGATAAQVLRNLDEWKERTGSTLVIVTHRLAEVTRGKLLMILGGRVVLTGDAQTLLNDPQQGNDIRRLLSGDLPTPRKTTN
ncbi:hypothetical protein CDCA_CDCA06G1821 [Cyanidium caldarium]|uniref:Probable ATP-dependent transporter ycf16 n=1 Tax=Cyanidium caldarium TaxID=2771 RepID=A0AAV9IUP3_CYACA|nr:hypothetical protein CDCA_CDCA06G1821 [Cyanidium caldarium]